MMTTSNTKQNCSINLFDEIHFTFIKYVSLKAHKISFRNVVYVLTGSYTENIELTGSYKEGIAYVLTGSYREDIAYVLTGSYREDIAYAPVGGQQ